MMRFIRRSERGGMYHQRLKRWSATCARFAVGGVSVKKIYLDTAPVIYLVERIQPFLLRLTNFGELTIITL